MDCPMKKVPSLRKEAPSVQRPEFDKVEARQRGLRKVRTKKKAENWSIQVPDGGDFLSDVK